MSAQVYMNDGLGGALSYIGKVTDTPGPQNSFVGRIWASLAGGCRVATCYVENYCEPICH